MTEQPAHPADAPEEGATSDALADALADGPPPVAPTGVAAADAAAQRLTELGQAPLDEHVEIYEDVHRRLQEGLADLDEK